MEEIIKMLEVMQNDTQISKENLLEWIQTTKKNIGEKEIKLLKYDHKIEILKEAIKKLRKQ